MEAMLDSTLAFLRGDMSDEEVKVVDVATVLSTICDDFADRGKPVVLSGASHGLLKCRPLALKRAIYNLVDNAIKYGARADVALRNATGELVITVEDRGPGIPEIERERVFDTFYRVEESRSRDTGGTGLGLTVARAIVRAHGGDIFFEDRDPEGLRVVVRLPKTQGR
jgi:signal transduction histidine kinase